MKFRVSWVLTGIEAESVEQAAALAHEEMDEAVIRVEPEDPKARLEYPRGELRAERLSRGEIAELQSLREHIDPSGTAVFVDDQGREVRLYISVDVDKTTKGQAALKAWRAANAARQQAEAERLQRQADELDDLISEIGYDEAMRRLKLPVNAKGAT